jgi:DNA-binding transcriptional MerR regulator
MKITARESYRTVDLARAAGTHENTVRLYAEWGFLATPERAENGYRLWRREDIDQMLFARLALHGMWPGRRIRESALALVRRAATGDLAGAARDAARHLGLVEAELENAEAAAAFLESWARGEAMPRGDGPRIGPREAADAVSASPDQIRNWERNRLVNTPRDPDTGRRAYGPEELGRIRVIRSLLLAGYSVSAILRMVTELDRGRTTELRDVLDNPRPDEDALTAFDRWLHSLDEQRTRARALIDALEEMKLRAEKSSRAAQFS